MKCCMVGKTSESMPLLKSMKIKVKQANQNGLAVMSGGDSLNPSLRVYRFLSSRKHDDVIEWFSDYKGVFHSDKYRAYEKLEKEKDITWFPARPHSLKPVPVYLFANSCGLEWTFLLSRHHDN